VLMMKLWSFAAAWSAMLWVSKLHIIFYRNSPNFVVSLPNAISTRIRSWER
jgi:hypothetical protein